MIDRWKGALVLLGAGLAVVGSFQDTYSTVFPGDGQGQRSSTRFSTSLWVITSNVGGSGPDDAFYAAGWPVVIAAVLMAVAVVLMVRNGRTALVGRPLVMAASGLLAGIVLFYVHQVRHEQELMRAWQDGGLNYELTFQAGTYLLVAGAIVGLVGAAFAQRVQRPEKVEEEGVVVHQLGNDDDTPPFGIAIAYEEQETR